MRMLFVKKGKKVISIYSDTPLGDSPTRLTVAMLDTQIVLLDVERMKETLPNVDISFDEAAAIHGCKYLIL